MILNGGPVSWKASRQGGVTLSSSEAEFIAASQAGQEVLYLRALLEGFAYYSMVLQRSGKITRLASSRARTLQTANARVTWTYEYDTWFEMDP